MGKGQHRLPINGLKHSLLMYMRSFIRGRPVIIPWVSADPSPVAIGYSSTRLRSTNISIPREGSSISSWAPRHPRPNSVGGVLDSFLTLGRSCPFQNARSTRGSRPCLRGLWFRSSALWNVELRKDKGRLDVMCQWSLLHFNFYEWGKHSWYWP